MRCGRFLYWSAFVGAVTADADFVQVRRKLSKDMSGRRGETLEKYFHESIFHPHYDGRFADHVLNYNEQKHALRHLVQTYLTTLADIGVETWLMHGSLLGWWWNRQIMPWDSDIDVQVMERGMYHLATYYNMSVFHYKTPRLPQGRDYLLEVNPHYQDREQTGGLNAIDARWIDTETGLFVDITAVHYNLTHPAGEGMLSCKDGHEYRVRWFVRAKLFRAVYGFFRVTDLQDTYLFPLRSTVFEDTPVKIPYGYREMLESEYGAKALANKEFHNHVFDDEQMKWLPKISTEKKSPAKG